MDFTNEIGSLQNLMQEVLVDLDKINSDNFDEYFHKVMAKAERAQKLRSELKMRYPIELLKKNEKELLSLAKQISVSYDNLIKKNREESTILSAELKTLMNTKKIAKYKK